LVARRRARLPPPPHLPWLTWRRARS